MNDKELIQWLRDNYSGVSCPSRDAADRLEHFIAAIQKHKDTFVDEQLEGEKELWSTLEQDNNG